MKNFFIIIFLFIFILNGFSYKNEEFYYSIDIPNNWIVDDSQRNDAIFMSNSKDAFVEVCVLELNACPTTMDVLNSFINRYNMKGERGSIIFCNYEALYGFYSLNHNGADLKLLIVIFKDNYFYYVIMGYSYSSKYNIYKDILLRIMNSLKIYYDNGVIYSNTTNNLIDFSTDEINLKNETKKATSIKNINPEAKNKKIDEKPKNTNEYHFNIKWDSYNKNFIFYESDLIQSQEEIKAIVNPNIWEYFDIDTGAYDYEFTFWRKFYQEMFNKNYYRIQSMVEFFKKEALNNKWDSYQLANSVIKSIQVISYERPYNIIKDNKKGAYILDYFTPNEVAYYKKGDCDTKSLMMIMILRQLGYDAILYYSKDYGHAMVGLNINGTGSYKEYNGKKYYFIESTYPGWKIGDLPPEMNDIKKWRIILIY